MLITMLTVGLIVTGWLWARGETVRRQHAREEDHRDGLRRLIDRDPHNIGAHEALGDSLRAAGHLDQARDAYHGALDAGADRFLDGSARAKLRSIDSELHARGESRQPLHSPAGELYFCRRCGAANPPDARACEACGETIGYDSFWDALRDPGVRQATLESVIVLGVVLLCFQVFARLPLLVQASVLLATIAVVAWRFLRAIEGPAANRTRGRTTPRGLS